jgi:ABC-2 type transport system permease protein
MFRKIAAFELRYQLSSPAFWVSLILFFLLAFVATTAPQDVVGLKGAAFINSPFVVTQTLSLLSVLAIFITTALVANVVVRDDETGYGQIILTAPISKFAYLFGRFSGAFIAAAVAFASVPLGAFVASRMPGLDPLNLGPFRPQDYLYAYFLIAMPALFVTSSAAFALATATRSMRATYVGVVALLVLYLVSAGLSARPPLDHLAALLDPFGLGAVNEATRYWTTADRNTHLPPLAGIIAYNRVIWFGISCALLVIAYRAFRFEPKAGKPSRKTKNVEPAAAPLTMGSLPSPRFDAFTTRAQLWAWTRFEMAQVFKSPVFFVLLALGLLNAFGVLWLADRPVSTGQTYPVTRVMIFALQGAFWYFPVIIAIYYAGELVWRERERRTHEIIDACPVSDATFVLPKIAAIVLVLLSTYAISVVLAMIVQTLKGYHHYELGHYLLWYVLPSTVTAVQAAVLAIFVQALSPQKYVGWAIMLLYVVAVTTLARTGFEDNLYLYGAGYSFPLSDMNGAGKFWIGPTWFNVYWSAAALVLAVLAYALWRRGAETRLWPRLARLPRRLAGPTGVTLAVALAVLAGSGGYIYYNTHILNEYRTTLGDDQFEAAYEKALLKFENVPQPRITDVAMNVAIFPHQTRVLTTGTYRIENRTAAPLASVHVRWARDLDMESLTVDGATPVKDYGPLHYVIYAFDRPMAPGESRLIHFRTVLEQRGFKNRGDTTRIVDNGTFLDNADIAPSLGMTRQTLLPWLLTDPAKRRRYGLPQQLRPAKLEDDSARAYNALRHDSDWVTSDISVSTVADQTPMAPGDRVSETVADGRRSARFKSTAPMLAYFSIQSAAYATRLDKWNGVDLAVYYDPRHPSDVEPMLASLKVALDVYTKAFGPYQFHQVRILEVPDYADFGAKSFAGTIQYTETGFIEDLGGLKTDPQNIDHVTLVTAHELGHQWWAHQVIGADMQGWSMMTESFAQYSAMLVVERLYGPEHVRKFLKYSLDHYLRGRGGEGIEELPLERVEDQPYVHYDKGAMVMYRLKEAVGEDVVNRSLRRLLAQYSFKPAPYPSSKDFVTILRQEAGPKYSQLITDLFEKITLYDLKAVGATSVKRPDGRYDVALTVDAHKYYADGKGHPTEAPLNEAIQVGAFLIEPDRPGFDRSKILAFQDVPIVTGRQTLHLIVDRPPAFAGIDPYIELIDQNSIQHMTTVRRE